MSSINKKVHKSKNGKPVTIRTAKEDDAEAYLNLVKLVVAEDIYSLVQISELTTSTDEKQKWLKANIENQNHLAIVAEVDGQIVGQLDFSNGHRKRIAHTGEFGMVIHKDHREVGIGSMLMEALVGWAKSHPQIEKIGLAAHKTNDRAIALYKKHGFQIEGIRIKDLKFLNGKYVDTVIMGLWVK